MKFAIARLIIWPRDQAKAPRVVSFAEIGINLITGSSRSGKSAIIKIIDYCLGSRVCTIPKLGPIRRSSAWYGIVVRTEEGYKLLARRDPDDQEATDDYMLAESADVVVPERPTKNANRDIVKILLARLARIPQATNDFDETGSGFKGRASFGDMTSFMFQPQSIVANDRVLFYEASDEQHARKLREIFPLVLGAVDAQTLDMQHRLAEVRRLLEKKRRQLEAHSGSVEDYAGEVRGRFRTALDLGLVHADASSIDQALTSTLVTRLQDLGHDWLAGKRPNTHGMSFTSAARIAELRQKESELAQQRASLRIRQIQLRELSQARKLSEEVLVRERDRLAPASWLVAEVTSTGNCLFCGSESHTGARELARLGERAAAVEAQWRGLATVPPMLDGEEGEVRRAETQAEEELRQVRAEKTQLEQLTAADRKAEEQRAVYAGKLLEFLHVQKSLSDDGSLAKDIQAMEVEEEELRSKVDAEAIAQRKEDALILISKYAQHYGGLVELEENDGAITLDTRELNIRVLNNRGESAWLYQIGSGANHLGYHVAMMLALHQFFIAKPIPYVPSLLVLDQPSQTQFPDDMDEDAEQEELQAVHRAFVACASAVERTDEMLQIIVSEHAGQAVWSGIKHLTIVERWRRGRKLIPWHWDAEALAELDDKRADSAIGDLMEEVLWPAIATRLGVQSEQLPDIQIERAVFAKQTIAFQVRVSITNATPTVKHGESDDEAEQPIRVVRGAIQSDLSVSIAEIVSLS